ncbi:GHKL domain-containing protein [bacterium]|nr:GHKL domain-containing protein [bacterium]
MVYNRFRILCTIRVIVLALTTHVFFYLLSQTSLYVTTALVGITIIYQIYALIIFVEKTNRDLTRFLESIRHEDFSQTFSGSGWGSSFDELKSAFSQIITDFRKARTEREESFRYLQIVVQHVPVGLIAFTPDGDIELINNAARRLFKVAVSPDQPSLRNIKALEAVNKSLVNVFFQLKPGQRTLVKFDDGTEWVQLVISATDFKLREQKFTLVSLQNIQSELEEKEMEAWQNLIRVLTHEIMNSVTPISSLASTVNDLVSRSFNRVNTGEKVDQDSMQDIHGALGTIQKRSEGLIHFVEAYRNLTKIPAPNFRIFAVNELFHRAEQLLRPKLTENKIQFQSIIEPPTLELTADLELVEQVLINLLINAIQATQKQLKRQIKLTARLDERGHVLIQVADNGPGIIDEAMDKIFIPFFTTKEDGSGIGLALSRQVMRLHRGTIGVQSRPNIETVFTLRF